MARRLQPVEQPNGCWHWPGSLTAQGYPLNKAHRRAYVEAHGPLPEGHEVEHECHSADRDCPGGPTCEHRRCVRPDHLTAATHADNVRASRRIREQIEATHCPQGHPYSGDNLYLQPRPNGTHWRACRACRRVSARVSSAKYRARRAAA